jgi:ParB/RepB/Spo0J family partition protein
VRRSWQQHDQALAGLMASMREQGQLAPVLVRRLGATNPESQKQPASARYELLAGYRRYLAAKTLGWKQILARVIPANDADRLAINLAENLARKEIEEGDLFPFLLELRDTYGWGIREIARRIGRSPAWVSRLLAITQVPEVRALVEQEKLSSWVALSLIALRHTQPEQYAAWLQRLEQTTDPEQLQQLGRELKAQAETRSVTGRAPSRPTHLSAASSAPEPAKPAESPAQSPAQPLQAPPTIEPESSNQADGEAIPAAPAAPVGAPAIAGSQRLQGTPDIPNTSSTPGTPEPRPTRIQPLFLQQLQLTPMQLNQLVLMRRVVHETMLLLHQLRKEQQVRGLPPPARLQIELARDELDQMLKGTGAPEGPEGPEASEAPAIPQLPRVSRISQIPRVPTRFPGASGAARTPAARKTTP